MNETLLQTDAALALDGAIKNMVENRLTVEQLCDLAKKALYAARILGEWEADESDEDLEYGDELMADYRTTRDELYDAIRANHRDTKP